VHDASGARDMTGDVDVAEDERLDVPEAPRERQRLERDRIFVHQAEDHVATRPSSRNTWAASVPPLRICTCVSCSGGTTSLTVSSPLARDCGSIRSIV